MLITLWNHNSTGAANTVARATNTAATGVTDIAAIVTIGSASIAVNFMKNGLNLALGRRFAEAFTTFITANSN